MRAGFLAGKMNCALQVMLLLLAHCTCRCTFAEIITRNLALPAFNPVERRAAFSLSFLYITRMMGLFLLLPVLSVLAQDMDGATPLLIGLAVGIYALFQAVLQIPFGLLSDRFGRKPVILVGLAIFVAGSVVAALSDSIWGIIIGRALQGGGAISAVIMALAGDLTRDSQRTKIMAVIGISIGLSFILSIILGPLLMSRFDLAGIFYFIAVFGVIAALVVMFVVPNPQETNKDRNISVVLDELPGLLKNRELLKIDFGIFLLHLLITAAFVCIPLKLLGSGVEIKSHWLLYLLGSLGSLVILLPMVGFAERQYPVNKMMIAGIAGLSLAFVVVSIVPATYWMLVAGLSLFFGFLSVLESMLPSLASRTAPAALRGSAMGIYSTSQFLGAFLGGIGGGWLVGALGAGAGLLVLALICVCWLPVVWRMESPQRLTGYRLSLREGLIRGKGMQAEQLRNALLQVAGVNEVSLVHSEQAAYLKVDRRNFNADDLKEYQRLIQ